MYMYMYMYLYMYMYMHVYIRGGPPVLSLLFERRCPFGLASNL